MQTMMISTTAPSRFGGELAASVLKLLHSAREESELEVARAFIAKASSLLQVEMERGIVEGETGTAAGGLAPWQIQRVKKYVAEHLDEAIRVEDLSAIARLSPTHFSRAFKRSLSEAPHAYVIARRLERSRELMLTSDMPLSELALNCGFADQAHFTKLFRHHVGKSPAAWRREHREG
jgi:AraC family transcriptional regulator